MDLNFDQLRRPQWLMAGGAIALFIVTFFFKWFGASIATEVGGVSLGFHLDLNAWHSLTNTRWLLLATILAALFRVGAEAKGRNLDLPIPASAIVALLAGLSGLAVLDRIIDHPHLNVADGPTTLHYGAELGIYLGFIACIAIVAGAFEDLRKPERS